MTNDGSEITRTALLPKRGEAMTAKHLTPREPEAVGGLSTGVDIPANKGMMQKLKRAGNSLLAAAGNIVAVTAYELSEILSTQTEERNED